LYNSSLYEFEKASHRRLDIDHRIMRSLEVLIEEESMEFGEFWWFEGKSSTLQLTVIGGGSHRTDSTHRRIFSDTTESLEFVGEDLFVV
jgi:hypothetical protein